MSNSSGCRDDSMTRYGTQNVSKPTPTIGELKVPSAILGSMGSAVSSASMLSLRRAVSGQRASFRRP